VAPTTANALLTGYFNEVELQNIPEIFLVDNATIPEIFSARFWHKVPLREVTPGVH
jgi:hypothetical protein